MNEPRPDNEAEHITDEANEAYMEEYCWWNWFDTITEKR